MRLTGLIVAAAGVLVLASGGVLGQNYNAADAVSLSRLGTMRCSEFVQLGRAGQADVVRRMVQAAPVQSLSTPTGPNYDSSSGKIISQSGNPSAVAGTPLSAGQLIAACQAVSPRSTLRSAYARFNSSTGLLPDQTQ